MWFPIDCNVLVHASGEGMREYAEASYELLRNLEGRRDFVLAIDYKRKILREYEGRIRAPMFAHHWLTRLHPERIRAVRKLRIPKGALVELLEARLHKKDHMYVEAAYGADKVLVTADFTSFSATVITILHRSLGIAVLSPQEALRTV